MRENVKKVKKAFLFTFHWRKLMEISPEMFTEQICLGLSPQVIDGFWKKFEI